MGPAYFHTNCENNTFKTGFSLQTVFVDYIKDKEIRRLSVPGSSRVVLVGMDGNLYVSKKCTPLIHKMQSKLYSPFPDTIKISNVNIRGELLPEHVSNWS